MLMLHAAVSLSQADRARAASFRRDRSDSMEGANTSSTRCAPQIPEGVRVCLFLTLSTVWQNIVLLWRETEQQSDRCLGSLIDGSCKMNRSRFGTEKIKEIEPRPSHRK